MLQRSMRWACVQYPGREGLPVLFGGKGGEKGGCGGSDLEQRVRAE